MKEDEEMEKNYQHLTSIVGIGLINGAALIAYTGNFKKITTPNKMSCYCGCFTFYEDSGHRYTGRVRIETPVARCSRDT